MTTNERMEQSHNDQTSSLREEQQRQPLDQDKEQYAAADDANEESLQLRGDEPVSELYIWGNDYHGQLGVGSEKVIHNLPKVCSFNIVVTDVSCGEEHTVFVQGDGGYVYSMGNNSEGRLGTGNPELRSCNVPTLVDGLCNIKKVSCGTSHTLALSEDGQAYAWGQAFYGALGLKQSDNGGLENVYQPKMLSVEAFAGEAIKDVEAGSRHSIFVTVRDKVFGCGDANQGQLGLGDANRDRVIEPTQIKDSLHDMVVQKVACGKYHTLFLVDNKLESDRRELWACGANNFGQIGNNSNQNMFRPVRVDPRMPEDKHSSTARSHRFAQVSAWHASAAVTEEGVMYVWGSGIFGEFKRPRKVKLQNNILVQSVNVGGSFIVIVDQDNKIVVWGSNSNGEIGVGDSKIRNHPTRLETIEDKTVSRVAVGGSYAFAIGKTTNRMENSIFDDVGDRSQLSGIHKNGASQIIEAPKEDARNRSLHSLEEQLQQINLHSGSKKRQDSDQRSQQPQRSQDRSFGNFSNGQTKFDQAANRVSLQNSSSQPNEPSTSPYEGQERNKSLEDQIQGLKHVLDDKEKQIRDLQAQQQKKHEDYQDKLHRFKEMQDQELGVANKTREENKALRMENDRLRDEVSQLKLEARDAARNNLKPSAGPHESSASHTNYLAPTRQDSSSHAPTKPNYFPGVNSTLPSHNKPSTYSQFDKDNMAPSSSQQPNYQYDIAQRRGTENHSSIDASRAVGQSQSPIPQRLLADEIGERQSNMGTLNVPIGVNEERFKQTYLQSGDHSQNLSQSNQNYQPHHHHLSSIDHATRDDRQALDSKLENVYKQKYSDTAKTDSYLGRGTTAYQKPISVEDADKSQDSSAKKRQDFQRSYTAEMPGAGVGFMRQQNSSQQFSSQVMTRAEMGSKNLDGEHVRRSSQLTNQENSVSNPSRPTYQSSFAKRSDGGDNSQTRLPTVSQNNTTGYLRDRISTGRVDNLRSMGNDLMMRPSSRDGASNFNAAGRIATDVSAPMEQKLRNSSSGFYQPSNMGREAPGYTGNEYRRNTEENDHDLKRDWTAKGGLPEPSEIQNRLRNANQFAADKHSGDDSSAVKRALTPNAVTQQQLVQNQMQSRVAYKPSYERISSQQNNKDFKENGIGASGTSSYDPKLPNRTDFGGPTNDSQKEQTFKQRPNSGNGRDPLYATQNNLQSMLKFDNLVSNQEGAFTSKYSRGDAPRGQDDQKGSSPMKPSRQDYSRGQDSNIQSASQMRNSLPPPVDSLSKFGGSGIASSSFAHQTAASKYAFSASTNNRKSSIDADANEPGASRPPAYKPLDYNNARYSHDHVASGKDELSNQAQLKTFDGATRQSAQGGAEETYRLSIDAVSNQAMPKGQSYTPSYHASAEIATSLQQPSSYARAQASTEYDLNRFDDQRQQPANNDFAGNSKPPSRSPFSMQHLNDQQQTYSQTRPDATSQYHSKLTTEATSMSGQISKGLSKTVTSYTPQGSGRRSESLMEPGRPSSGGGEDIRVKLARYKKEREDFEMVRMQFRKKNSELGASDAGVNLASGNINKSSASGIENTPVQGGSSQLNKYGGGANGSGGNGSNIFAVDQSTGSGPVQAFTAQVTGGSPAFGAAEQNYSRDH